MNPRINELMTAKEVAEKLGISKQGVFYHGARGHITQIKAFGMFLFLKRSVNKFKGGFKK